MSNQTNAILSLLMIGVVLLVFAWGFRKERTRRAAERLAEQRKMAAVEAFTTSLEALTGDDPTADDERVNFAWRLIKAQFGDEPVPAITTARYYAVKLDIATKRGRWARGGKDRAA